MAILFEEHKRQNGNGWDKDNAREAILNALKEKRESKGLESSAIDPPCDRKLSAYHAALISTVGITERLCKPKTAAREAAEAFICSML